MHEPDRFYKNFDKILADEDEIIKLDFLIENREEIFSNEEIQFRLIKDKSKKIREFIIDNTFSEDVLAVAAKDMCSFNRILVSEKTKNENTLSILSFDPVVWVRCSVSENPYVPKDVYKKLLFDNNLIVRISASKNIAMWNHIDVIKEFLEKRRDYSVRIEILDRKIIPTEIFKLLVKNQNCPLLVSKALFHRNSPKELRTPYESILSLNGSRQINELEKIIIKMIATTENIKD